MPTLWSEHCQDDATYGNKGGDSGGAVFEITSGNDVAAAGVNWAGNGFTATFSPLANIEESTYNVGLDGFGGWFDQHYRDKGYLIFGGAEAYERQYRWS